MGIKEIWNKSSVSQRSTLAKALGYKAEWGTLRYEEIGKRGGGMLLRDLTKVNKKRGGGYQQILWI